jgi:predicted nuclease of restriction endonuclease-like (RecB) superfamily
VLVHQIESGLYRRQGSAVSNFDATLPAPQSDLAQQLLKDPYVFDFLMLDEAAKERDLELALLDQIERFLLELGTGFSFMGRQHHLEVGGEDFYLDLLFYHVKLHCFVIVELKIDSFRPEYAGKMNFYLAAVDDLLREPVDQPSIGLIICKEKNRVIVEYSLRDTKKPMGVAEYVLTQELPVEISAQLPTAEQVQRYVQVTDSDTISIEITESSTVKKR